MPGFANLVIFVPVVSGSYGSCSDCGDPYEPGQEIFDREETTPPDHVKIRRVCAQCRKEELAVD